MRATKDVCAYNFKNSAALRRFFNGQAQKLEFGCHLHSFFLKYLLTIAITNLRKKLWWWILKIKIFWSYFLHLLFWCLIFRTFFFLFIFLWQKSLNASNQITFGRILFQFSMVLFALIYFSTVQDCLDETLEWMIVNVNWNGGIIDYSYRIVNESNLEIYRKRLIFVLNIV